MKTILTSAAALMLSTAAFAADLTITSFTPNEGSLFPVSSNLIEGPSEVILVDAQFEKDDAQQLVDMIKATGKSLTTVFISHKDPDFYFGLDTIRAAYPDVKIVASPETVKGIEKTIQLKYDFWGPILKENAPTDLIVPDVLQGDSLTVDGETVQVVGLDGHDPVHTFLWVPSEKTVLGGVVLYENIHVWMADTQTPESRDSWRATLDQLLALNPDRIIPGHVMGESAEDASIVDFTKEYVATFEAAAEKANGSEELIAAMQAAYPSFENVGDLKLGAQVIEGERSWP
ncbi:MBL fold metallo-hydrolase [Tropicibacter sp. R16_0]|uniref:MBL fold metallo-hydrolase n=1 Tax=Tropicibacter sp. R16_0 TaxID=2821102 RepID=UPI001AD951F0|nr:MBL fold metallo-hydrolase [Tropicibacter sp. R16_0]MBO9452993.1 MBL fold metallo-hydrolase [Tropicibacter sp. R16_0]